MRQYNFEYTRQGFTYLLFGASFTIIGLGIFLFRLFFKDYLSPGVGVTVIISVAVIFFFINKNKIKKLGNAKLGIDDLTIEFDQSIYITFVEIEYYSIYKGKNMIVFTLGFKDGTKFKLGANNNFCNEDLLKTFLEDFQVEIENYNKENKAGIVHS